MAEKAYAGVFEKMSFPPYVFKEYPKMVQLADKSFRTVQNQREELALVADLSMAEATQDPVVEAKVKAETELAVAQAKLRELEEKLAEALASKEPSKAAVGALYTGPKK